MRSHLTGLCLILLMAVIAAGCSTQRTTTTERTAVERALLSEAAEATLSKLGDARPPGSTFYLDTSEMEAVDGEYIISALRLKLAKNGLRPVAEKEDADILVYPRSGIANMDDSSILIGIPAIPLAIPGAGVMETPELAFFKRVHQRAHNKLGVYGIATQDNSLAFDMGRQAASRHYTRWTVLFIINFRTTNLPEPYSKRRQ